MGAVEVAVHPHEGPASTELARRRIEVVGEAAVQVPCKEERFAFRIDVRKTTALDVHGRIVAGFGDYSQAKKAETGLGSAG
jgi:hypothetical protein